MTTTSATSARLSEPPARQIRLLGRLATPAAIGFGLLTLWLAASTWANARLLADGLADLGGTGLALVVVGLMVDAASAVVAGLITYRLAVEVPRVVRGWEDALAERAAATR